MLRRRSLFAGGIVTVISVIALSGVRLVSPAVAVEVDAAATTDAGKWATRIGNLDAIHAAIKAFRADTGDYPNWLSQLHPTYLPDASQLIDPCDPTAGGPNPAGGHQERDPNLPVSYKYELIGRWRDQAIARLEDHDGRAPLVRTAFQRNYGEAILSADGRIYLSAWDWKTLTRALEEERTPHDNGIFLFAMDLRDPPAGFIAPARLTADVDAMVERFAAEAGESSGRYHAEAILRAWSHDREGAARAIAEATRRAPDDVQVLYHYARLMHQMGRHGDAIPLYERVVATNRHEMRQWVETHRDLSDLYAEAGSADKHARLIRGFEQYLTQSGADMPRELLDMYMDTGDVAMLTRVVDVGPEALKTHGADHDIMRFVRDANRRLGNDAEADRYHRMANPVYELVGKKAPAFVLRKADGSEQTSSMLGSEPLLLALLRSYRSPDHRDIMAAIEAVHREYASHGLAVMAGFGADDPEGQDRELRAAEGVASFPLLFNSRRARAAYGVTRIATVLIDRSGFVRYVTTEPHKDQAELSQAVPDMLGRGAGVGERIGIAGVAKDDGGRAVEGAWVVLYAFTPETEALSAVANVMSAADGSFDLGSHPVPAKHVGAGGAAYQLTAVAPGRAVGLAFISRSTAEPGSLAVTLGSPRQVHGRVVDEQGAGLAGVDVSLRSAMAPNAERDRTKPSRLMLVGAIPGDLLSTRTDADGAFTIDSVPPDVDGMFVVHREGYARIDEGYKASSGEPYTVVLPTQGVLTGRVYYERWHIAKARRAFLGVAVTVITAVPAAIGQRAYRQRTHTHEFRAQATTDSDGRYRIEGIPPGYLNIWADAEGHACTAWDTYAIQGGQTHTADLYLVSGGFITGQVIDDATGKPVLPGEFASVSLHGPSRPMSGYTTESVRVAGDGTFRMRVAPGVNFPWLRPRSPWKAVGPMGPTSNAVHVADGETVEMVFRVARADAEAPR